MSPVVRVLFGSLGLPAAVLGGAIVFGTPAYFPSEALAEAARSAATPDLARERMLALFNACVAYQTSNPTDLTGRLATLHSFENDVGLFGTTHIACTADRCTVTATALIPHAARADVCARSGAGRHVSYGRRRGWSDWF